MSNSDVFEFQQTHFSHITEEMARTRLLRNGQDSFRLFHGRGHFFPELNFINVDLFDPVLVVTLYGAIDDQSEQQLTLTLKQFCDASSLPLQTIIIQKRYLEKSPWFVVWGALPENVYAQRGALRFNLSFAQQNIGFFLDIEPARKWLESVVKNANVLNLFSYTCAFSVVAKEAGARAVVNIDMSKRALSIGQGNHQLNDLGSGVSFLGHDIFKSWGKLKRFGPYDVVVIDPPSFQKGSFIASKDYRKVLGRMSQLVAENGYVLACLNAPEIQESEFLDEVKQGLGDEFIFKQVLPAASNFPEIENGKGLKMVLCQRVSSVER